MNHKNRIAAFALAVMLAIFNAYAQPSTSAYQSKPLVSAGANHGGYILPRNAVIDGAALNDARDYAFVVHWQEGDIERTALFTKARLLARDGDVIDGKRLTRILGNSLSMNAAGMVGFEGSYGDGLTAIFADGKLKVALSQSGSPYDFGLLDNGEIQLRAAIQAPATATPSLAQTAEKTGASAILRSLIRHIPSPVPIPDPSVIMSNPRPTTKAAPGKGPVPTLRPCTASPPFAFPPSWDFGDAMSGPITSDLVEEAPKTKAYDSKYIGRLNTTVRLTQFNADCKPIIIAVVDAAQHDRVEIRTPVGLLAYSRPDGFLEINGFRGKVLPSQLTRADTPIRVNRHGVLLIPINIDPEGFAILLATPTGEMH